MLEKIKTLRKIDINLADYYQHVFHRGTIDLKMQSDRIEKTPYEAQTIINKYHLEAALGISKTEEILQDAYLFGDTDKEYKGRITLEHIMQVISDRDKQILYEFFNNDDFFTSTIHTLIHDQSKSRNMYSYTEQILKSNSVFVELDFTKPINELIEFVTTIKNNFDKDPNSIQNIYKILGGKEKIFMCDLEECDIYKSNNIKPIGGRLADVLFIYDCKKAGLDNKYILDEINNYWIKIKNLYKDEFQEKTLREYHNLAIDYIDNEKYKCYLSGYDLSQE